MMVPAAIIHKDLIAADIRLGRVALARAGGREPLLSPAQVGWTEKI